MSKTDKTQPVNIKLHQNPNLAYARHDHRDGVCTLTDGPPVDSKFFFSRRGCYWGVNYYSREGRKFYGRCSKTEQAYREEANGASRAKLRAEVRDLIKSDAQTRYDHPINGFRHRHQALWDCD